MKKIWRCSNCKQMSTRLGNLKRHFERKHNGMGHPILQYIFGNSIITPEETLPSIQVFRDESAIKLSTKTRFKRPNPFQTNNNKDWMEEWSEKYIEPILKFKEFMTRMNSSQDRNLPMYMPQSFTLPPISSSSIPLSYGGELNSVYPINTTRNYDKVSGFKVDICLKCFTTYVMPIRPRNLSILDGHKCESSRIDAIKKLEPKQYVTELFWKFHNFTDTLFRQCKEWADNTSGQLYLIATKVEIVDESGSQNYEIDENGDSLPFIKTILSGSKIKLNDSVLYEFLKLSGNQTKTTITIKSSSGESNLCYILAVSI